MSKFELTKVVVLSCCIIVFAVCGVKNFFAEQHGALYVVQDGVNVYICEGVLKTHGEKTMNHAFYCDNGTIVENLVNFTIKEKNKCSERKRKNLSIKTNFLHQNKKQSTASDGKENKDESDKETCNN